MTLAPLIFFGTEFDRDVILLIFVGSHKVISFWFMKDIAAAGIISILQAFSST